MILKHARWERFAQLVATGQSGAAAYRACYGARGASAEVSACRLLRNAKVRERISELQRAAETEAVMSLQETLAFLTAIVRTPVGWIDENSPLCQFFQRTKRGVRIVMPNKLSAIELYAKLAGWLPCGATTARVMAHAPANGHVLTEERRLELVEKRRRAIARLRLIDQPMKLEDGVATEAVGVEGTV
ncbi:MAG TPA: terminase small subunit [Chthoniobacteraceae bacterium]|jgi:hypothetical protein|nr:terminase small subunit [Chthoniobacteraceae bacterium]